MRLRKRRQCFPSCSSLHRVDEDEVYWRRKKGGQELEWPHSSTHLISQLAQCFTNAMVGPRSWIGGLFNRFGKRNEKFLDYTLSPIQKALIKLWNIAFPNVVLTGLISEQWKDMGWQEKPKNLPGYNFLKLLGGNGNEDLSALSSKDEEAFDVLYCVAFELMDAHWLAMHASYMEFNEVLQVTREQLQRELSLDDVHRIQDLPAYNLLYK
ncbi:hypothetical protein V6N11_028085 [Hibiscus sabdariffa]|uniref:ELMO domain-containing protein n=2 Tax=Hibiscus sabdariffa TaxID=183260 RepID=A0ABR1ZKQ2_9ROSI